DDNIVNTDLFDFLTDADFPLRGNRRPPSWKQAVRALRNEMATHAVIVSASEVFSLEIHIIDWQGRLTLTRPALFTSENHMYVGYTGNHYMLLSKSVSYKNIFINISVFCMILAL
ncbi:hypothetical protein QZH41_009203, partial [Actinostola sp. cb2023]